jgi:hypothetical protein
MRDPDFEACSDGQSPRADSWAAAAISKADDCASGALLRIADARSPCNTLGVKSAKSHPSIAIAGVKLLRTKEGTEAL